MKIAIIGGGITGLTAAYELSKLGHEITVFERESHLGGLACGFREKNWQWHLEGAYHHMFTNDDAILSLAHEIGIGKKLIVSRPITANYWQSAFHQFDSPIHLLKFNGLTLVDKVRTGALVAFCKLYPFWQTLEGVTAKEFFERFGGENAWSVIWEPLMTGKFGQLDSTIAASWLWARIHKRTPSLVYFEGGFQTFVNTLEKAIIQHGGTILIGASVETIRKTPKKNYTLSWKVHKQKAPHSQQYDRILFTTPTPIANSILPGVTTPESLTIPHLHAQVLILETRQPILEEIYWLSILDRSFPFLAVVAHSNFMDKRYYGGNHITYVGNYLPDGHKYLTMTKQKLLKEFAPYIERIGNCTLKIENSFLFTAPFAQPVHQINYSRKAPPLETPLNGVYLANMDSIFPWDRGTNYAVELGNRAASTIIL